jgi:hypothetical protein
MPLISDEIKPYIVRYPYVSNKIGEQPDGNPILYQAVYLAIKRRFETDFDHDKFWVRDTYQDAMLEPGLISRGSHKKKDRQAHDDYIGLVYSSHITGEFTAALDICEYGKKHNWFFYTADATWNKAFFGRMPGFIAHVKLGCRIKLNIFDQIYWFLRVSFSGSESGKQLSFVMVDLYQTQPYRYKILDWAVARFEKAIKEGYPDLMGSVFGIYYSKDHLFAKRMRGRL